MFCTYIYLYIMFCVVPTIISGHIFNQAPHSHPFLGASPCDPTFTKERQAGLHQYKLVGQDQGPNLWSKNKLNIRRWKYVQQQSQQICPNKIYAFHSCSEWIRCAATQKRNQNHQRVAVEEIVVFLLHIGKTSQIHQTSLPSILAMNTHINVVVIAFTFHFTFHPGALAIFTCCSEFL